MLLCIVILKLSRANSDIDSNILGIYHMVRVFENDEVTHVDDCVDPVRDLETITEELCLKDIAYYEKEYNAKKDIAKRANKKLPEAFVSVMDKVGEYLKTNQLISKQTWTAIEVEKINETLPRLITSKPVIYLLNLTKKAYLTKKEQVAAKGGWLNFSWYSFCRDSVVSCN